MGIAVETFLTQYSKRAGTLSEAQKTQLRQLVGLINCDRRITSVEQRAYMLATVRHETADTFSPISERGAVEYFDRYEPGTPKGRSLGNLERGDGFLFRGRGYVQITGRLNYSKLSDPQYANRNLVVSPDDALIPDVAYKILSCGLAFGLFTGAALDRYINHNGTDYFNARRCVNGLDRALKIAGLAKLFEEVLKACS